MIVISLIGSFSTFLMHERTKELWPVSFWELYVSRASNSIDVKFADDHYYWEVKSAFENSNKIYILYYLPFDKVSNTTLEYGMKKHISEDKNFFNKVPFYLIYNEKTLRFTYLNAKKEIIRWDEDFNRNALKRLDTSNFVYLQKYNFETSFDDTYYGTGNILLSKQFNDYLNSQINK